MGVCRSMGFRARKGISAASARRLGVLLALAGMIPAVSVDAFSYAEVGDAGQLITTAQNVAGTGVLESIAGTLSSQNDIDLYGLIIDLPSIFSVTVSSALSGDNDAQLFLFDGDGFLVLSDDDDGPALSPQFNAGEFNGAPGVYYLAFDLFNSDPADDPLTSWTQFPAPAQSGSYTLTLSGARAIPEPTTAMLVGLGVLVLSVSGRRRSCRVSLRRTTNRPSRFS